MGRDLPPKGSSDVRRGDKTYLRQWTEDIHLLRVQMTGLESREGVGNRLRRTGRKGPPEKV